MVERLYLVHEAKGQGATNTAMIDFLIFETFGNSIHRNGWVQGAVVAASSTGDNRALKLILAKEVSLHREAGTVR